MLSWNYFSGFFRRFRSLILRREVEIVGQCNACGECCRGILIKDEGRWMTRTSQFENLVKARPEHDRFLYTGRDDFGFLTFTCKKLGDDNLCTSYEDRPALCRNYPTKSLYYQGADLRADCGYSFRCVTFTDVLLRRLRGRPRKFSDVLRGEIEQDKEHS